MIQFLIEEYVDNSRNTIGLSEIKGGKQLYKSIAKSYLTDKYTPENVHKNVALDPAHGESPKPTHVLENFSDLVQFL